MGEQKTVTRKIDTNFEVEEPAATNKAVVMAAPQLSALLSNAVSDAQISRALENTLNYINRIDASKGMSAKEYKENLTLLEHLVAVRNSLAGRELQPKVADECIDRLGPLVEQPPATVGTKTEIPLQFQQFGFFQLADIAGAGSVAFGNLPDQMMQQLHEGDFSGALTELNKLASAFFTGGDTKKAGQAYLKYLENLGKSYGYNGDEVNSFVCSMLTQAGNCGAIKNALKNGNYGSFFTNADASFSEWQRSGTNNYLTWTSQETKLILSVEAAKYILKGKLGEFGAGAKGMVYEDVTRSVKQGEPGYWDRTEKTKHAPGGGAFLYGEVGEGRWKAGAKAGVDYVPGGQGGWYIPVEAFGETSGGTDATSQTVRLQVKASPEVTGKALSLEAGVLWNALFFQKGDTAVGYVFGVKAARMSTDSYGNTFVDLVIEGQIGPTFQKIFREQGLVLWVGAAGIVQEEMPQGMRGAEGPLQNATKIGGGLQAGVKGKKLEASAQIQVNPISITDETDLTGRPKKGEFEGVLGKIIVRF